MYTIYCDILDVRMKGSNMKMDVTVSANLSIRLDKYNVTYIIYKRLMWF